MRHLIFCTLILLWAIPSNAQQAIDGEGKAILEITTSNNYSDLAPVIYP